MGDKKQIKLTRPYIDRRARQVLEYERPCSDWEVLKRIAEIAREEDIDIEFYREDPDGIVAYDLSAFSLGLKQGLEMRPRVLNE